MQKYLILDKKVGETPLSCLEDYRKLHPELAGIPMAYAGRLDPMASGKMVILVGDECKKQTNYHGLDKEYEFSVLLGIESDSQDVLGRLQSYSPASQESGPDAVEGFGWGNAEARESRWLENELNQICKNLSRSIELPYPIFSAKTVQGKPLHTWTMERRLNEITIPTKQSEIYQLEFIQLEEVAKADLVKAALSKVNSVPPVTEIRKALGNDFRRVDVRQDWDGILNNSTLPETYQIAHFRCVASSGTYMRTLASEIAKRLDTIGLAWHIHRTIIGIYNPLNKAWDYQY